MQKRETSGFSLIEVLVVVSLLSLVIIGLTRVITENTNTYRIASSSVWMAQRSNLAFARISEEAGYAKSINTTSFPSVTLTYTDSSNISGTFKVLNNTLILSKNAQDIIVANNITSISFTNSSDKKTVYVTVIVKDTETNQNYTYKASVHIMNAV